MDHAPDRSAPRFDFDAVVDRAGSSSYKWDRYQGRDVIPMWVADMDFVSAPAIVEALERRAAHGVFGYSQASDELYAAVRSALLADYAWEVAADDIVWLPGLVSGLNVVCRAVGSPGDAVVTFTPVYPPFLTAPVLAGRNLVKVPLTERSGRWEMDVDSLEASLTPGTRLLLLCSPHNPVGRVWSRTELEALADVARRHDLIIASDEIHAGLVLDDHTRHLPVATLAPDLASRTITLMAPSKTFNTPGLGCSFAVISDPALRRDFCRAMEGIVPHVNLFGYVATQAAYEKGAEWQRALLAYLRGNRDLVEREIGAMPGLRVARVEATYLAWIDTRGAGFGGGPSLCAGDGASLGPCDGASPRAGAVAFFEAAGVGLSDGAEFGAPGYVRLNFGCRRALLAEALGRMRNALAARS